MGELPSHPELLDHLAAQFIKQGWSVKQLIRSIVLSRTYQLSSLRSTDAQAVDPENRLLSHMTLRRINAEAIRDAILTTSGRLNVTAGGSTIRQGSKSEFGYVFNDPQLDGRRRSVYVPVFRNSLLDLFEVFDFADPNLVVGRRAVSTLPTQALYLMNSPWVAQQATLGAERILGDTHLTTEAQRVDEVYLRMFGRLPKPGERQVVAEHLRGAGDELQKWTRLIHLLTASVDFRYLQ
jgi:hypothetical protein